MQRCQRTSASDTTNKGVIKKLPGTHCVELCASERQYATNYLDRRPSTSHLRGMMCSIGPFFARRAGRISGTSRPLHARVTTRPSIPPQQSAPPSLVSPAGRPIPAEASAHARDALADGDAVPRELSRHLEVLRSDRQLRGSIADGEQRGCKDELARSWFSN